MLLLAGCFVACGAWLTGVDQASATTYYVDKAGSNGNSCATAAAASSNRSFAKLTLGTTSGSGGVVCLSQPGDILIVGDGTYVEPEILLNASHFANGIGGTSANHVTIQAEHKWLAVISSTSSCNPNISLYASYIAIDGLSLVINASNVYCTPNSAAGTGVRCWSGSLACHVRNIKTDDPTGPSGKIRSHGIKTNAHDSIIENNDLDAGFESISHRTIFRHNTITGGGGRWRNGVVVKGGSQDNQVYDNIIISTAITGSGIILGGATCTGCSGVGYDQSQEAWNSVAYNNVVQVANGAKAIVFMSARDSAFFNNVVFNGSFGMDVYASANVNNTWKNNISNCGGVSPATSNLTGTYTIDYNNFFNCTGVPSQAHPITGDPQFVDPQSDWRLNPSSPAIGSGVQVSFTGFAGQALDVSKDKQGATRTVPWSLGIYDGTTTTVNTPPTAPRGLSVQ